MPQAMLKDPVHKQFLRWGWSLMLDSRMRMSMPFTRRSEDIRVFYGGARPGDVGGPLVKVKRLKQFFEEDNWRFNIVYTLSNTPYLNQQTLELIKRNRIPIVHNQNGVFYAAWFAGDWESRNAVMARSYHMADHVFYQSEFCRKCADRFLGERQGSGEVLYNAVDTNFFAPEMPVQTGSRPFRFLITGKIDGHLFYRIESTMRALALARKQGLEAELEIAGWIAPQTIHKTTDLAKELLIEDAVNLTGPYRQVNAPAIYQRADAYVMIKHNDPCPNTVLEALACGLPVLYSSTGGVPELAGDCGVALECEESWENPSVPTTEDIADGMSKIVSNHPLLSEAARKRAVENFDIAAWISRHRNLFKKLLSE